MPGPLEDPTVSPEGIIELSPDGVLAVDGEGRITFANRTLTEMTGYQVGELLSQPIEILLPDWPQSDRGVARATSSRRRAARSGTRLETFCRRKDGSRFVADVVLREGEVGDDTMTVVAVRNAASSHGEKGWLDAEPRSSDLLEGLPLLVVCLDKGSRITFANRFFRSLTGYEETEVVGTEWFSTFVAPNAKTEVETVFRQVLEASGADRHVNPIVTKEGDQRLIAWFNTLRYGPEGSILGTLSVGEDITDRVRAEARLRALREVTEGVLSDQPLDDLLHLLARQVRQLVGADTASIVLPESSEALVIAASDGARADRLEGTVFPRSGSISGAVMRGRESELIEDTARDPRACQPIVELGEMGPAFFVPLVAGERLLGTLLVANRRGGRPFTSDHLAIVESVASHASVAVEYRRTQQEMQRLVVLDDRERIARDLHDHVIQRLFATGLSLTAVRRQAREPLVAARVADAVEQLDRTISDLRTSIFELRRQERTIGLREQILNVVHDAAGPLGFLPEVRLAGRTDAFVSEDVAHHAVGVIREALANVARHARARRVHVLVEVGADLLLRVTDDGIGIPSDVGRRSGLENLRARAAEFGGSFSVVSGTDGGTELAWRIPLAALRRHDPKVQPR